MAERKKATGASSETEAKREAEKKGTGKGGPREAKKTESKSKAQAEKKASSGKQEPKKSESKAATKSGAKSRTKASAKTKESATKSGGAKAGTKSAAARTAAGSTADPESSKKASPAKGKGESKPAAKAKAKTKTKDEAPQRPVVNARARFVRVTPRKARLVADQVRGMPLEEALALLRFHPRTASRDIAKVLDSAAANAEANHDLVADELTVSDITVDDGPTLRRYRPRALGRATKINKRTSHIRVALTPED